MSKKPKIQTCPKCNTTMDKSTKICPSCGAKNKKPFYSRWWFLLLAVIFLVGAVGSIGRNKKETFKVTDQAEKTKTVAANPAQKTKPTETKLADPVQETKSTETKPAEAQSAETQSAGTTSQSNNAGSASGIRPDFKAAMDSYEAYLNEYCEFMKEYKQNPSDMALVAKYADMMAKYVDLTAKFEAWESNDLNNEELKYYVEVQGRVAQKLIEAGE